MSNDEGSRVLISSHKCREQPSSTMSALEHGAKVPNALMTPHEHALALLRMASTVLMSTHCTMATYLWVFMRTPKYSWVLINLFWVLWSAPEHSWVLINGPVYSSGWFNNKQRMLTCPVPFLRYFGNISVQISPNNEKLDIFEIYTKRAVEKCPRWNF